MNNYKSQSKTRDNVAKYSLGALGLSGLIFLTSNLIEPLKDREVFLIYNKSITEEGNCNNKIKGLVERITQLSGEKTETKHELSSEFAKQYFKGLTSYEYTTRGNCDEGETYILIGRNNNFG